MNSDDTFTLALIKFVLVAVVLVFGAAIATNWHHDTVVYEAIKASVENGVLPAEAACLAK